MVKLISYFTLVIKVKDVFFFGECGLKIGLNKLVSFVNTLFNTADAGLSNCYMKHID